MLLWATAMLLAFPSFSLVFLARMICNFFVCLFSSCTCNEQQEKGDYCYVRNVKQPLQHLKDQKTL